MTDTISYTAKPRDPQWADLSQQHRKARERLENALADFENGQGVRPLNIVGPYGSGKSELMVWGFHHAWTQLRLPAIFVTLETLLENLPEDLGPAKLIHAIGAFLEEQTERLEGNLEKDVPPDIIHLAPDLAYDESLKSYFRDLFNDPTLQAKEIRHMFDGDRVVLFIDEIEQKYQQLMQRVPSDDQAPLREVIQAVEQRTVPYYLVGAFGLTSAYETVSDADTRREATVSLPIPDAAELAQLGQVAPFRNLMWWASRGRPGWALKLAEEWGERLNSISRMEEFSELKPDTIARLPVVDINTLADVFLKAERNWVMTRLLKQISPVPLEDVKKDGQEADELLNGLPPYLFMIAHGQDLCSIDDLSDALMSDLRRNSKALEVTGVDWALLKYYLGKILRAFANDENRIVFGGWRDKNEWAARAAIAPLLVLLQDMILEFEGDRAGSEGLLSFIDQIFQRCQIVGGQVDQHYTVIQNFPDTANCFREVMHADRPTYVSLAPKAVENLFPRIVARPLLTLHQEVRSTIQEQRIALESAVVESGQFLKFSHRYSDIEVIFIFVPAQSAMRKLQDQFFQRQQRDKYMTRNQVYLLLSLSEDSQELQLDPAINSDIRILEQIRKVQQERIEQRRLQDFLMSLWHNVLVSQGDLHSGNDVFDILDGLIEKPGIGKSERRKLEYYRDQLQQRILDISRNTARAFHRELRKLFDPESDDFPYHRIDEARERIKEARAVEQVALAFSVRQRRERTLQILYKLRQLDMLKSRTRPPHGYGEFLNTYAAVKPARGDIGPATNLDELTKYLARNADLTGLRTIARDLGLDLADNWLQATETTDRAPLLKLFAGLTESQKVFIRGLSFNSYLEANREELLELIGDQLSNADQLENRLGQLMEDIDGFNESLGRDLLSYDEVADAKDEVEELKQMLRDVDDLPPAVLYILYRFSQSALDELETTRQRWEGDDGLYGWQIRFQEMLGWEERLEQYGNRLKRAYGANENLKGYLLGSKDDLVREVQKRVEDAIMETLNELDRVYEMSDLLPDVDLSEYNEALESIEGNAKWVEDQAAKIDELIEQLEATRQCVKDTISKMGGRNGTLGSRNRSTR